MSGGKEEKGPPTLERQIFLATEGMPKGDSRRKRNTKVSAESITSKHRVGDAKKEPPGLGSLKSTNTGKWCVKL